MTTMTITSSNNRTPMMFSENFNTNTRAELMRPFQLSRSVGRSVPRIGPLLLLKLRSECA